MRPQHDSCAVPTWHPALQTSSGRTGLCQRRRIDRAQELKARIARLARTHGWQAHLERAGDGWRADVLTTSPSGNRTIVWEIQTSRLDEAAAFKRTQLHVETGHEIVWLLLAGQNWDLHLPTLLIEPDQNRTTP